MSSSMRTPSLVGRSCIRHLVLKRCRIILYTMKLFIILSALTLCTFSLPETVVESYNQPSHKADEVTQGKTSGPRFLDGDLVWKSGISQSSKLCWRLTYTDVLGAKKYINLIATGESINVALQAMNTLTVGQGLRLGEVTVEAEEIAPSECGF